jgi:hypothetical protein
MNMLNRLGDNPQLSALLQQVTTVAAPNIPMNTKVAEILVDTYAIRYVKPSTDLSAIHNLADTFKALMGHCTTEIQDGIGEYYRILTNRELPAFEWLLEAFHVASKKDDRKRNFPYVVGMIRCWMKYGFGHIPSQEEDEVISYFEEVTGTEVTPQTRLLIQNLMGTYGAIKVTRMVGGLERGRDISFLMAYVLKGSLEEKFPVKVETLVS